MNFSGAAAGTRLHEPDSNQTAPEFVVMVSPRDKGASGKAEEEARKIARATQRPGQTKEQTKLIAQGIQKGIEQYKKQEKAKARERDKRRKKADKEKAAREPAGVPGPERVVYRQSRLAWMLLFLSWVLFALYSIFFD